MLDTLRKDSSAQNKEKVEEEKVSEIKQQPKPERMGNVPMPHQEVASAQKKTTVSEKKESKEEKKKDEKEQEREKEKTKVEKTKEQVKEKEKNDDEETEQKKDEDEEESEEEEKKASEEESDDENLPELERFELPKGIKKGLLQKYSNTVVVFSDDEAKDKFECYKISNSSSSEWKLVKMKPATIFSWFEDLKQYPHSNATRQRLSSEKYEETEVSDGITEAKQSSTRIICALEGDYTPRSNVQGDHLDAASTIKKRQRAFIKMLNDYPQLAEKYIKEQSDDMRFFVMYNGKVHGTALFYKSYYNTINNIWPLCGACNRQKSDKDSLEELKKSPFFGKEFIQWAKKQGLKSEGETAVLRTTETDSKEKSKGLADLAVEFFFIRHAEYVQYLKQSEKNRQVFRGSAYQLTQIKGKKGVESKEFQSKKRVMERASGYNEVAASTSTEDGSSGSDNDDIVVSYKGQKVKVKKGAVREKQIELIPQAPSIVKKMAEQMEAKKALEKLESEKRKKSEEREKEKIANKKMSDKDNNRLEERKEEIEHKESGKAMQDDTNETNETDEETKETEQQKEKEENRKKKGTRRKRSDEGEDEDEEEKDKEDERESQEESQEEEKDQSTKEDVIEEEAKKDQAASQRKHERERWEARLPQESLSGEPKTKRIKYVKQPLTSAKTNFTPQ